ncbi:MAG: hypothetical protein LBF12_07505 [Christensenellaceae bacterium]|nr:hypothetical protein [Christensenellaceae bacterium]
MSELEKEWKILKDISSKIIKQCTSDDDIFKIASFMSHPIKNPHLLTLVLTDCQPTIKLNDRFIPIPSVTNTVNFNTLLAVAALNPSKIVIRSNLKSDIHLINAIKKLSC